MLWEARDAGPILLIPAAWTAAAAAQFGYLSTTGMFIAHLVMAAFITFFAVTGWSAMATGALRAWRLVLVVGLGLTLAGIAGFLGAPGETVLLAVSLVGWMVLPALGLFYTGQQLLDARPLYWGGGVLSILGAALFVATLGPVGESVTLIAYLLVGLGQTAGILDAARR